MMKTMAVAVLLAACVCVASAGLFSKPKPTEEEQSLCNGGGRFADICSIGEKTGVSEKKQMGEKWRHIDCGCYGEGGEEAADEVAKAVGKAIGKQASPPLVSPLDAVSVAGATPMLNGGISHHWRLGANGVAWEINGSDPTKRFG